MKKRLSLVLLFPALLFAADKTADNCGCSCCEGKAVCCCHEPAAATKDSAARAKENTDTAVARHPLRGAIVAVRSEESALLVKHEAIPGYMRAMTMLFKVDRAALASLKKGQSITATLVERDDGFHLEDIKLAE
jgi:Cu/Ag efflux protein CusF